MSRELQGPSRGRGNASRPNGAYQQLCSATFTRPQHVGRHLRAHTGDRPYECKECPLRFARR